jgi:DNA-binding LacI/PurR family transcriptional regulator
MRTTRADVAKLAGVSTATVSYVLNNSRGIAEDTRKRVLTAVEELKYKPDMIARSLVTNETMQLSVVVDNITNPFYGDIVLGFENAAIEKGYFVNICTGYKNIDEYFENFISRRLDGVFIVATIYKFHIEKLYRLVDEGIKVVKCENIEADLRKVSSVENDYMTAMNDAVGHLYNLGHRNIAYISGQSKILKCDPKLMGFQKAVEKFKLGNTVVLEGNAPYSSDIPDGYNLACKLLSIDKSYSAVICLNDLMAMGAIKAFNENGLRVPEDISVMGFDDIPYAAYWDPPITTMAVPKSFLGSKAFELLYTNMKKGNTGYFMNRLQLIERKSTSQCGV